MVSQMVHQINQCTQVHTHIHIHHKHIHSNRWRRKEEQLPFVSCHIYIPLILSLNFDHAYCALLIMCILQTYLMSVSLPLCVHTHMCMSVCVHMSVCICACGLTCMCMHICVEVRRQGSVSFSINFHLIFQDRTSH